MTQNVIISCALCVCDAIEQELIRTTYFICFFCGVYVQNGLQCKGQNGPKTNFKELEKWLLMKPNVTIRIFVIFPFAPPPSPHTRTHTFYIHHVPFDCGKI